MPFTREEFQDFIRDLESHPEWQDELRRLLLSKELLALPDLVRDLAEAQQRTEQRLEELAAAQQRTEQQVAQLAEAQRQTEERLLRLEGIVQELAEAQRRTEQQVAQLAEAQRQTEERLLRVEEGLSTLTKTVEALLWRVDRLADDVGALKEESLERRYRDHAPAYFGGPTFRGVRALPTHEVARLLDQAIEQGKLTWEDRQDILQADLVVRGRFPDRKEAYLVVEVSWGVGITDVDRAMRRAALLRKVVERAFPAVAGRLIVPEALEWAEQFQVVQVIDGKVIWPESLPPAQGELTGNEK